MGDYNKVISFVLGLLVVILVVAVIAKRIDFSKRFGKIKKTKAEKITPSPTPYQTVRIKGSDDSFEGKEANGNEIAFRNTKGGEVFPQKTQKETLSNVKEFPKTGPETGFIFLIFASGAAGLLFRKLI